MINKSPNKIADRILLLAKTPYDEMDDSLLREIIILKTINHLGGLESIKRDLKNTGSGREFRDDLILKITEYLEK